MNKFILSLVVIGFTGLLSANVEVSNTWARNAKKGHNSAAFGSFKSSKNTALVKATQREDLCEVIELHTHKHVKVKDEDGHEVEVMQMRPVEKIDLPKDEEVQLKQGGLHIMLIGLKKDIIEGDTVNLTLHFADGTTTPYVAIVKKKAAMCHHHKH